MDLNNKICDYKLFQNELIKHYNKRKRTIKNQVWFHLNEGPFDEQKLFSKYLHLIEHLFDNFSIEKKSCNFSFNEIILEKLKEVFSSISFELDNNNFQDYNNVRRENMRFFNTEDISIISSNEILNSLFYFGRVNFISSEILNNRIHYTSK
jgi:hypothetical protein